MKGIKHILLNFFLFTHRCIKFELDLLETYLNRSYIEVNMFLIKQQPQPVPNSCAVVTLYSYTVQYIIQLYYTSIHK